jgi:hypothetical protein
VPRRILPLPGVVGDVPRERHLQPQTGRLAQRRVFRLLPRASSWFHLLGQAPVSQLPGDDIEPERSTNNITLGRGCS